MKLKSPKKYSIIYLQHYFKLAWRSVLFIAALIMYIRARINKVVFNFDTIEKKPLLLPAIWLIFTVEMALRFFPSKYESMGCQKQFKRNYISTNKNSPPLRQPTKVTLFVAFIWLALNACIGAVYFIGWIDQGILMLISLAFSVCDVICILFFCPFQTWIMKNKCCTSCRIYNWDFAMMFTPLLFIPSVYTYSLVALSLALLVKWEIKVHRNPEYFSEHTNACLSCALCNEKLCHHKKQLQSFLISNKDRLILRGNSLFHNDKYGVIHKNEK